MCALSVFPLCRDTDTAPPPDAPPLPVVALPPHSGPNRPQEAESRSGAVLKLEAGGSDAMGKPVKKPFNRPHVRDVGIGFWVSRPGHDGGPAGSAAGGRAVTNGYSGPGLPELPAFRRFCIVSPTVVQVARTSAAPAPSPTPKLSLAFTMRPVARPLGLPTEKARSVHSHGVSVQQRATT